MNGFVTTAEPSPPPAQTITLELSVEEFAMLSNLVYNHLSGRTDLRTRIETVFRAVRNDLRGENQTRFDQARTISKTESGWSSEKVAKVFA